MLKPNLSDSFKNIEIISDEVALPKLKALILAGDWEALNNQVVFYQRDGLPIRFHEDVWVTERSTGNWLFAYHGKPLPLTLTRQIKTLVIVLIY
jgi:GH35 family endo-1,4-beta-xylanase